MSWNLAAGVLLYSRFQESRIILLGGSAAKGSFGFSFGFSSSGSGVTGCAGCIDKVLVTQRDASALGGALDGNMLPADKPPMGRSAPVRLQVAPGP